MALGGKNPVTSSDEVIPGQKPTIPEKEISRSEKVRRALELGPYTDFPKPIEEFGGVTGIEFGNMIERGEVNVDQYNEAINYCQEKMDGLDDVEVPLNDQE